MCLYPIPSMTYAPWSTCARMQMFLITDGQFCSEVRVILLVVLIFLKKIYRRNILFSEIHLKKIQKLANCENSQKRYLSKQTIYN